MSIVSLLGIVVLSPLKKQARYLCQEQVACQDGKTQFFRGVMNLPGFLMDISYSINVSFCFKMFQNVSKCLDALHCQLFQGFTPPPGTKNCTKKKAESLFQAVKSIFSWKKPSFFSGIQKFILIQEKVQFFEPA
jgi:hypothetical protein